MNTLTFQLQQRRISSSQSPREYFDFLVDGISLKTLLNSEDADLISPLGWGLENYQKKSIEEFKLKSLPELNSGRTMIYI